MGGLVQVLQDGAGFVAATGLALAIALPTDLLLYAAVAMGINWFAAVVHAIPFQSEKYFDLLGATTFSTLTILSAAIHLANETSATAYWRSLTLSVISLIWALRLGSFLFLRIHGAGSDNRFDDIRAAPLKFFSVWTLQGLWAFATMLPVLLLHVHARTQTSLQASDVIGFALWLFGFAIEVFADAQKTAFKKEPTNRRRFVNVGLWYYSRHPNYFGEITLWIGLTVVSAAQVTSPGYIVVACFSPLLVATLLIFVSGIPILEAKADAKWGAEAEYQLYKQRTSVLVPWWPKKTLHIEVRSPV
ncbi:membrane protein [Achlya hypogyna]|uniref:Membrane protein n=1 Tax=Achlya hypogyna TaxID=1202772 RepID=A0A1V9YNE7_ACHHY|nr:membrane protein [Achlya hypogyna]